MKVQTLVVQADCHCGRRHSVNFYSSRLFDVFEYAKRLYFIRHNLIMHDGNGHQVLSRDVLGEALRDFVVAFHKEHSVVACAQCSHLMGEHNIRTEFDVRIAGCRLYGCECSEFEFVKVSK